MLKVGVFGVGHLGKFHLNNWAEIPQASVVGFYDPSDEIAEAVTDEPSCRAGEYCFTEAEEAVMCQNAGEEQGKVTLEHDAEEDRPEAVLSYQILDYHR